MINYLQQSDYSSFPFTERRVSHLVLNQSIIIFIQCNYNLESTQKTIIRDHFTKTIKKNSLLHSIRLLKEREFDEASPLVTEKQLQTKKLINLKPLKKALEKITLMRQEQLSRRKSAYGGQFGEMTTKQFQNLPTIIEQHKQIDGQRFALSSFADILERKKRKRTTKKQSILRQLSKQESLVEYDNLERPPSCKTPPKQIIIKQQRKSKLELTKEKQFQQLDKKMISFLSGKPEEVKEFVQLIIFNFCEIYILYEDESKKNDHFDYTKKKSIYYKLLNNNTLIFFNYRKLSKLNTFSKPTYKQNIQMLNQLL